MHLLAQSPRCGTILYHAGGVSVCLFLDYRPLASDWLAGLCSFILRVCHKPEDSNVFYSVLTGRHPVWCEREGTVGQASQALANLERF